MSLARVVANLHRAGSHLLLMGIVVLIAGAAWLTSVALKRRAGRGRSEEDPADRGPTDDWADRA